MIIKSGLIATVLAFSTNTNAQMPAHPAPMQAGTELQVTGDKGSEFQLEVRQMPLAQVLRELSAKTGTEIHYSVLPEGMITATCVGDSLKPVLECLLNRKADIIVRYNREKNGKAGSGNIAEAWVLGSKLEVVSGNATCKADSGQGSMKLNRADSASGHVPEDKPSPSDLLVDISQTGKAEDRAQAIGDLLAIGRQNDPKVKEMLEHAVHDPDPAVRAQAVSTLTHRDDYKENAPEIIREALQDDSVDVRLMAVDGMDDAGLLQQAVNDSDETVSMTAKLKLEELLQRQKAKK